MESSLTNACTIRIENFEGPFDLLFHLIEKNQFNIYDIPINTITDQYMDYLFAMQEMDLEIASEFLVMASTLLHIKSKMLLPSRKEEHQEEEDPREELVSRLLEYRKYKDFSYVLREREKEWSRVWWKLPEPIACIKKYDTVELVPGELKRVYQELLERNRRKINPNADGINRIIRHEKVSLRSKMREIIRELVKRGRFRFFDLFSFKSRSLTDIVTGFLAILELAKLRRARLEQRRLHGEIYVSRVEMAPGLSQTDTRELDSMA
ncbi:MAG TPA: segregation/condensation protein A [Clostridiales bacterium]|nr:segregation/condensation protein A [Clostridiaceae bacterium]HPV01945.1 segregation/condensation protein A [Clostridiales bacterium]